VAGYVSAILASGPYLLGFGDFNSRVKWLTP